MTRPATASRSATPSAICTAFWSDWPLPSALLTSTPAKAAGTLPRQSQRTRLQFTRPCRMWTSEPTGFITALATRSLETAASGGMPKKITSTGVIRAPPPMPVRPTMMPTPKPAAVSAQSIYPVSLPVKGSYYLTLIGVCVGAGGQTFPGVRTGRQPASQPAGPGAFTVPAGRTCFPAGTGCGAGQARIRGAIQPSSASRSSTMPTPWPMLTRLVSTTMSASVGSSYGSSMPVIPVIRPARALAYKPLRSRCSQTSSGVAT